VTLPGRTSWAGKQQLVSEQTLLSTTEHTEQQLQAQAGKDYTKQFLEKVK